MANDDTYQIIEVAIHYGSSRHESTRQAYLFHGNRRLCPATPIIRGLVDEIAQAAAGDAIEVLKEEIRLQQKANDEMRTRLDYEEAFVRRVVCMSPWKRLQFFIFGRSALPENQHHG